MMKRYLAFAGSVYYPEGGIEDLKGHFDTVEEACQALTEINTDFTIDEHGLCRNGYWAYVYDQVEQKVVKGLLNEDQDELWGKIRYFNRHGLEGYKKGLREDPPNWFNDPKYQEQV
jgi:hypothetical protein